MKATGKGFGPIKRVYDFVELLITTNETNEEFLKRKYPNCDIVRFVKNKKGEWVEKDVRE